MEWEKGGVTHLPRNNSHLMIYLRMIFRSHYMSLRMPQSGELASVKVRWVGSSTKPVRGADSAEDIHKSSLSAESLSDLSH
jgi:hypothetical protein